MRSKITGNWVAPYTLDWSFEGHGEPLMVWLPHDEDGEFPFDEEALAVALTKAIADTLKAAHVDCRLEGEVELVGMNY